MPIDFDLEIKNRLSDEAERRTEEDRAAKDRNMGADRKKIDEAALMAEMEQEAEEPEPEEEMSPGMKAIMAHGSELDAAGNKVVHGGDPITNFGMSVAGGARDAVANTVNGLYDLAEMAGAPEWDVNDTAVGKATRVSRRTGLINGLTRGGTQFLSGFVGGGMIFKAIAKTAKGASVIGNLLNNPVTQGGGKAGRYGRELFRGAQADLLVFDPAEGRLADVIPEDSAWDALVPGYLRSQEDDTAWEGRVKNAVEGLGLGLAFPALWRAAKATRAQYNARRAANAKGVPLSQIDEVDTAVTEVINARTKLELADDIAADGRQQLMGPLTPEASARGEAEAWVNRKSPGRRANDRRFSTLDEQEAAELVGRNERRQTVRHEAGIERRQERPAMFDEPQAEGAGPLIGVGELNEIRVRTLRDRRTLTPEAKAHIDAAERNSMTIEEHNAGFNAAQEADSPMGRIAAEAPEEADALAQAGQATARMQGEMRERLVAELAEAEANLARVQDSKVYADLPDDAKVDINKGDDGASPRARETQDSIDTIKQNVDNERAAEKADGLPNDHTELDERAAAENALEETNDQLIIENLDGKKKLNLELFEDTAKARAKRRFEGDDTRKTGTPEQLEERGKYGIGDQNDQDTIDAIGKIAARPGEVDEEVVARALVAGNLNSKYLEGSDHTKNIDQMINYAVVKHQDLKKTRSLAQMTAGINKSIDAVNQKLGLASAADQDVIIAGLLKDGQRTANNMENVIKEFGKARILADYYRHGIRHLKEKLDLGTLNEIDLGRVLQFMQEGIQAQKNLHRIVAGTGRALKSNQQHMEDFVGLKFDDNFFGKGHGPSQELETLIGEFGGRDAVKELLENMAAFTTTATSWDQHLRALGRPGGVLQMPTEYWFNSLLSGFLTGTVNFGTTAGMIPMRMNENYAQGLWDLAKYGDGARLGAAKMSFHSFRADMADLMRMSHDDMKDVAKLLWKKHSGAYDAGDAINSQMKKWNAPGGTRHPVAQTVLTGQSATTPGKLAYDVSQHTGKAISPEGSDYLVNKTLRAFGSKKQVTSRGTPWGRFMDIIGHFIGIPITALNFVDEAAKVMQKRAFMREEIYMHLYRKDFRHAELDDGIQVLMTETLHRDRSLLPPEVFEQFQQWDKRSSDSAAKHTFTNDLAREGGWTGGGFATLRDAAVKHPSFTFLATFMRTTTNLGSMGLERSPAYRMSAHYNNLKKKVKDGDLAGKPDVNAKADLEATHVRAIMGTAVLSGMYALAEKGFLTGSGPTSPEERAALMATGWKPESVVITSKNGDKRYIQFRRLDPIATWISTVANMSEMAGEIQDGDKQWDEAAHGLMWATIEIFRNKTVLTNISNFLEAMGDGEHRFDRWRNQMIASFVPSVLKWGAHAEIGNTGISIFGNEVDTMMRETNGLLDTVKARLPGFSADLPPRRNFFGEFVDYPTGYGSDSLSPLFTSISRNTIVNREVARLATHHGFGVSMRAYDNLGGVLELDPHDRDRLIVLTKTAYRKDTKQALTELMESEKYKRADDTKDGKQALIHNLLTKRVARGKELLRRERPDLDEQVRELQKEKKRSKRRLANKAQDEEGTTQGNIKTITASLGLGPN